MKRAEYNAHLKTAPLYSTLEGLKRRAKRLKKETGITHTEALEHMARKGGYDNFTHARRELGGGA